MIGVSAISELPISALPAAFLTGQQSVTVRYASQTFATRATDSPAHTNVQGRIARGVRIQRSIQTGDGGAFGSLISTSFGEIELNNADGALDGLINDFTADGRPIRLYIGATEITAEGRERVQPFADFALVYSSVAGAWSLEHDVLKLRVRDLSVRLRIRLQSLTYSGEGDATGPAELTGRTMPTAFGRCLNVTAQLVDPTILAYQVHSGRIDSMTAVYDQGIEVPFDVDYGSYALLAAATVPAGTYATSLTSGHFRLGSIPTGNVTADIRGHRTEPPDDNYTDEHGGVMLVILRHYASFPDSLIDLDSFAALDVAQPESMGLFLPAGDESTVEEVLAQIALSAGAFVGQDRSGLYRAQRLEVPALAQHWSFDDRDIVAIEREEPDYSIPWKSWSVGYQVNFTVQDAGELAGGVSSSRRLFLESERRWAIAQDPAIALAHTTSSGSPPRSSFFLAKAVAETEAERLLTLYTRGRALYRFVVKNALFSVEIGQTVRLTYPRWNLANGKHFVAVGVGYDADRVESEILVFG